MFRLVSLNLNGIRSAASKGFEAWAESVAADCMGVQEIKAQADTVVGRFDTVAGMQGHFHYAEKKGYSGVGLYTRKQPSAVVTGIGDPEFDAEGRYIEARFDNARRKLSIISCYFPSGSSSEQRQQAKYRFLALIAPHLKALVAERELILVGDINIAHKEIDLKNWKGNQKNSGFLPEERAWMTSALDATSGLGLVDVFRTLNPHPEQ
ncbi:MAG: exodeoxyribonuclease III, partial [Burkholderiales bacterium]|nr:exodeoxyribonuclease III [Burkholderiales bacterium]